MADHAAGTAALLEREFRTLVNEEIKDEERLSGLPAGFELLLPVGSFAQDNFKAVAIRDPQGNIYVHFNGTGDGNWNYNAAAYGAQPQPSDMQKWALAYFDRIYERYGQDGSSGNLYVTGHSQGGNNAQFVTMRSQYGKDITQCIALDAPGFSTQFVNDTTSMFGEDHYEQQRRLIYAYNGVHDYVSCLGQESVIPDENKKFLAYTGKDMDFVAYHDISGKLSGNTITVLDDGRSSDFRDLVLVINEKIIELPPEQQARAAEVIMAVIENTIGAETAILTESDLDFLKSALIPLLTDVFAGNSEQIVSALNAAGLEPAVVSLVGDVLREFNQISPEGKQRVLEALSTLLVVENGKITLDTDWRNYLTADNAMALWTLIPAVEKLAEKGIREFLRGKGVPAFVSDFVARHGAGTAGMVLRLVTAAVLIYDGIKKAWDNFKNKAGRDYAAANPYIKLNTTNLRGYASRIVAVNNRISSLDGSLKRLYWQVGFLDLWDIMVANLMTRESSTLDQVKKYLNNAADRFDTAENKACGHMGG